jgi:7,8-dihydropterin-6-yl-methyl-4-(beta-D-ribofuranosyl)aminobenzene 5'-phosphate synthase
VRRGIGGLVAAAIVLSAVAAPAQSSARVTVLYDAFGNPSDLKKDWGFAALVEYGGRRILFDTGNNAEFFRFNVERLGVDLTRLDAAVISHRHGDHTTGLTHLIQRNPTLRIYTPQEGAFFRGAAPRTFIARHPGLPPNLQYFDGKEPTQWVSGSPWPTGNFETVTATKEIFPGLFVITTRSEKPGTLEMNEVSLAVRTPRGLAVVVGCSHPGVEHILENAAKIDARLFTVVGGFHLVQTPEAEIRRVATQLRDTLKLERVAPAHCTSELGFAVFLEQFKGRIDHAGVGSIVALPTATR